MGLGSFTTAKSDKKRAVRAADDNVRRAREIAAWFSEMTRETPTFPAPALVCAEAMSFPRNASNAAKMAMTWGVLVARLHELRLPLLQASPKEVKVAACGDGSASKLDVQRAMRKRFGPRAFDRACEAGRFPAGLLEHPVDALATICACLETDLVRMLRR